MELPCNHEADEFFIVFALRGENVTNAIGGIEIERGKETEKEREKKSLKGENESIMIKLSQ